MEGQGWGTGGFWENKKDEWDKNTLNQEGLKEMEQRCNRLHKAEKERAPAHGSIWGDTGRAKIH